MMDTKNFAVLILSNGRAKNVITIKTLRKIGYTGDIYVIIDNEDEQANEYRKIQDVKDVIVFDKLEEMKYTDTADNYKDHRLVVYARNKCHDIAKDLGLDYFLELDDDYTDGNKGKLVFTVADVCMDQLQTQSNEGGLTDIYLDNGTYVKSFFSVIHQPQCAKISSMGNKFRRIHHKIIWDRCTPKILSEKYKK